jgi:hypothetical protein
MSNFIASIAVNAATWVSLANGVSNATIVNGSTYPIAIGVADASGNIAATETLAPGDSFPLTNIPSGAQVWGKIAYTLKTSTAGATGKDARTNTLAVLTANVSVYKPS